MKPLASRQNRGVILVSALDYTGKEEFVQMKKNCTLFQEIVPM